MKKINTLITEWKKTEDEFLRLKTKRDLIERKLYGIMIDSFWKDYTTPDGVHVSITETEVKDIDWTGLTLLLNKSEIENITKYSIEKKLLIITPEGKQRIRKLIKEGI